MPVRYQPHLPTRLALNCGGVQPPMSEPACRSWAQLPSLCNGANSTFLAHLTRSTWYQPWECFKTSERAVWNQEGVMITLATSSLLLLGLSLSLLREAFVTLQGFAATPGNFTKGPKTGLENRRKDRIHREFGGLLAQFSSVAQSCPTLCDPMNCSTPGLPVHHQLPEFTQTHVHWVGNAIQPSSCPLSAPSPPALNLSSSSTRSFDLWGNWWSLNFGIPYSMCEAEA